MNKYFYLPLLAGVIATTGCASHQKEQLKNTGIDLANLDTTVIPQNDFYDYATGGWQKRNPLKPEYARFGTFDELRENNKEQLRTLIEGLGATQHPQGSIAQKIADLYNAGLDSTRLNSEGYTPVKSQMEAINGIQSKADLAKAVASLQRKGVPSFFYLFIESDPGNSAMNIAHTYQGGTNMGDRDYYLQDDEQTKQIRAAYLKYIEQLFTLSGYSEADAQKAAQTVLAIETELAKASYSREELRDPIKNYNKTAIKDFVANNKEFAWDLFFDEAGIGNAEFINISQVPFMGSVGKLVEKYPLDDLKTYLTFNLLNASAPYMSDDFVAASFNFYDKTLSGKQEQQPRWKRSLETTNGSLGEAVGQMYVEEYFPPQAKEKMLTLVNNLSDALGQRIQNLEWMSDTTKAKAIEKLGTITVKIGYPDKWRDYSALAISATDSYWDNVENASEFEWDYMISQNEKPVDKEKWHMSPQTVNAYYSPATNEICFPAAILQPPFFYLDADDAVNYGAIGVVIGHEMTHGFDDQGRQFDKDGNLKDWWTADDAKRFEEKTQGLVAQYDSIKVLGDTHANGAFTLGENIADQGGLQVAYTALQNVKAAQPQDSIDGFTPEQRFFLSYATLWAGNIRDAEILRLTKIDPHSLGRWRVNGALPNITSFYEAFDVQPGNAMYLAPENRVEIW